MMNTPKSTPAVARFFRARVGAANFPPRSPSGLYRIESAMLFLPRKVYDARVILLKDLEDGKIASADTYQAMLDLDPDDHIAMLGLGGLRKRRATRPQPRSISGGLFTPILRSILPIWNWAISISTSPAQKLWRRASSSWD